MLFLYKSYVQLETKVLPYYCDFSLVAVRWCYDSTKELFASKGQMSVRFIFCNVLR